MNDLTKCETCGFPIGADRRARDGRHGECADFADRTQRAALKICSKCKGQTSKVDAEGRCSWCIREADDREARRQANQLTSGVHGGDAA